MTTKYEVAYLVGFLMASAFLIYYFFAHRKSEQYYSKLLKKYNDLKNELINARSEICELKKFPKPSESSRLDAALSEIEDLKARLRIAEATARDAIEKAKLSNSVREERKYYFDKYCELTEENRKLKEEIKTLKLSFSPPDEYTALIKDAVPRIASLPFAQLPQDFQESIYSGRLNNAFKSHLMILDKINMEAKIKSENGTYITNLHSCTCPDYTYRHNVCKHMLFLSYTSGLLLLNKDVIEHINSK